MAEVTPKFRPPRPPTGIEDNNASGKPRRTNEEIERSNKQAQQRLKLSLKKKDMLLDAPRAPPPHQHLLLRRGLHLRSAPLRRLLLSPIVLLP
jgi:hypothetical protein